MNFVLAEGKPKFETHEVDPPKKEKWKNKKRFKLQKKREKQKRKAANKKDPRRIGKKRKQKFANAEERIKYKLEKVGCHDLVLFLAFIFVVAIFCGQYLQSWPIHTVSQSVGSTSSTGTAYTDLDS